MDTTFGWEDLQVFDSGEISTMDGEDLGWIDSDGEWRSISTSEWADREDEVRAALKEQYLYHRNETSWPERNDWPENIRKWLDD